MGYETNCSVVDLTSNLDDGIENFLLEKSAAVTDAL